MQCLANEGIHFSAVHIDKTFPEDHSPTRKPGTGMLTDYLNNDEYDIAGSFVIGDRITDVQLAKNLGCRAIWLKQDAQLGGKEIKDSVSDLEKVVALETMHWARYLFIFEIRASQVVHERNTRETKIRIELNADGSGKAEIHTGLAFFDHMLDQIARHGKMDLKIKVQGDLQIDEHHTIEDTGIALGEAIAKALADKRGMERYGFALPMDDADAQVLLDFGGQKLDRLECAFSAGKSGGYAN